MLRCLIVALCVMSTPIMASTKSVVAAVEKELRPLPDVTRKNWTSWLELDRLKADSPGYGVVQQVLCKLAKVQRRPEAFAPIARFGSLTALTKTLESIKFSKKQIEDSGYGGHEISCELIQDFKAERGADLLPKKIKAPRPPSGMQNFAGSGFSLIDLAYWSTIPLKDNSGCRDPITQPSVLGFIKKKTPQQACMEKAYRNLYGYLQSVPVECKELLQAKGPDIFSITIFDYSRSPKVASCRFPHHMRQPWLFRYARRAPEWDPKYSKGFIVWTGEYYGKNYDPKGIDTGRLKPDKDGCAVPERYDLVQICSALLAEQNL